MGLTIGLLNHAGNKIANLIQNGGGDKDGKSKKKGTVITDSEKEKLNNANKTAGATEVLLELTKEGLLLGRKVLPLNQKIGTFKQFSKLFKCIKVLKSGIGVFSLAGTGVSAYVDYNDYLNGDISGGVLTYRTVGNVSSTSCF